MEILNVKIYTLYYRYISLFLLIFYDIDSFCISYLSRTQAFRDAFRPAEFISRACTITVRRNAQNSRTIFKAKYIALNNGKSGYWNRIFYLYRDTTCRENIKLGNL